MGEMDSKRLAEENRILEVRVGSHLFGTDNEDSDLDLVGVYMPWDDILFGVRSKNEVDLSVQVKDDTGRNLPESVDRKFHDIRKFFRLCIKGAPNILHVLMADERNIVYKDPFGFADRLMAKGPEFISLEAHERFLGYAKAQRHKMKIKPENYRQLEVGLEVLSCFQDHMVLADVVADSARWEKTGAFKDEGQGKHVKCGDLSIERGTFVKKARKMIEHRLSRATNRAVLFTKYGYDVKFASNLIQLLLELNELVETGWIEMPLTYAQDILDIKAGKYPVEYIDEWSEKLILEAEMLAQDSPLPAHPPWDDLHDWLMCEVWKWVSHHTKYWGQSLEG
jgi:hypothetical protein